MLPVMHSIHRIVKVTPKMAPPVFTYKLICLFHLSMYLFNLVKGTIKEVE